MKLKEQFKEVLHSLNTIEKKSFWTVAPVTVIVSVISLFSTKSIFNSELVVFAAIMCLVFPILMMAICYKTRNYNACYPILCIGLGAFIIPFTFLVQGGFDSGMPIMCTACTITCAFIYDKKWRIASFIISFISTMFVFWISKLGFGALANVNPGMVENDIILCYSLGTIGIYTVINSILTEVRHYVTDAEVLDVLMDKTVRNELVGIKNSELMKSTGIQTSVTVLFVDISRFTSITEVMKPEDAASFLNTFLTICDNCIHKNGGILDKFIGDCAMAYWNDSKNGINGSLAAIKTVFDIREELYKHEEDIYQKYAVELDFSAGIDYGDVVLGSIGSDSRKDFTIIGDAVNTASRLQGIASRGELLISNHVFEKVSNEIKATPVKEKHYLRGKNNPLIIYRVDEILIENNQITKTDCAFNYCSADETVTFHVCGCRGSFPVSGIRYSEFGGETSCYVIRKNRYALVIDCGSGLGNAKAILKECDTIDVLLTHVHYDHIIGLLNMSVFPKKAKITMYGDFHSWCGIDTINDFLGMPYWPINLNSMSNVDILLGLEYKLSEGFQATFYRADHPNNGTVIRVRFGGKSICIFADLEDPWYLDSKIAYGCDLMLYDGMFDEKERELHKGWGHSTWQEALRYAEAEKVKRLVVTHHNPENSDHDLLYLEDKARTILPGTIFARTGDVYLL